MTPCQGHALETDKAESGVHFTAHRLVEKQLNALRLADLMREKPDSDGHCMKAADELRRLHALCEEMGKALEAAKAPLDLYKAYGWPDKAGFRRKVDTALAKWKESK